ncbi:MAG TPA: glycosyltransferase family 4 protein [Terriglobia bacterium]|nr:glycosyltransferase family 4 protein [Terriglobia bacterium]
MKILLVHNSYQQFGGEDVVFEQERKLLESAGHEVFTYCRSNLEIRAYNIVQRIALAKQVVWASPSHNGLQKLLLEKRPDLVHAHNTFPLVSPSIYWTCKAAGIPVVQTLHNYRLLCPAAALYRDGHVCEECIDHSLWRSLRHGCYRNSRLATAPVALMLAVHRQRQTWAKMVDCYIALTQFAKNKYVKSGIPFHKIQVKPNFLYADPGARNQEGSYALYVGSITREKGLSDVAAAWHRLKVPIPLQIVGDGPYLKTMQGEASNHGYSNICFKGLLCHEEVLFAMKGARFVIFPSQYYENFPMTLVEAFACGVPVIASRLGSVEEIVQDGRCGLQFAPGNPDDLAAKVEWAWTYPREMLAMGRTARAEYEAKYTAQHSYKLLMKIYASVLQSAHKESAYSPAVTLYSEAKNNLQEAP